MQKWFGGGKHARVDFTPRAVRGTFSHGVWHALYVSTLVPVRFVWQPYLLWRFAFVVTKDDVFWERATVCARSAFSSDLTFFGRSPTIGDGEKDDVTSSRTSSDA